MKRHFENQREAWIELVVNQAISQEIKIVLGILKNLFCHYAGLRQFPVCKSYEYYNFLECGLSDFLDEFNSFGEGKDAFYKKVRAELIRRCIDDVRIYAGQWNDTLHEGVHYHLERSRKAGKGFLACVKHNVKEVSEMLSTYGKWSRNDLQDIMQVASHLSKVEVCPYLHSWWVN